MLYELQFAKITDSLVFAALCCHSHKLRLFSQLYASFWASTMVRPRSLRNVLYHAPHTAPLLWIWCIFKFRPRSRFTVFELVFTIPPQGFIVIDEIWHRLELHHLEMITHPKNMPFQPSQVWKLDGESQDMDEVCKALDFLIFSPF